MPTSSDAPDLSGIDLRTHREFLLELLGRPRVADDEMCRRSVGIDWDTILDEAGLALHPLLAVRLDERRVDAPDWVLQRVQWARRSNAMVLARRRTEFARVFAALEREDIPVIVLKGYALAHMVYPSPETRTMNDLDLWLDVASLRPAMAALEPIGWRPPWWRQTEARYLGDGDTVAVRFQDTPLLAELHRRPGSLSANVPQELAAIASRRVAVRLGESLCHVLRPDDMLLHLCLHIAEHHRFVRAVSGLLDVTLVIEAAGDAIDWGEFAERCVSLGVAGWVATTLAAAEHLLGAKVPPGALAAFHVPALERLCDAACEQVWASAKAAVSPTSVMSASTRWARASRLFTRLREVLTAGEGAAVLTPGGMLRVIRRIRYTVQFSVPHQVAALWRVRGAAAEQLRRSSQDNLQLQKDLASAGLAARAPGTANAPGSARES